MKLRIRFGEKRFTVDIENEDATVLALKQAVCNAASVRRDISTIKISLNGKDIIDENDVSLSSHGLVNGDLVYVISSTNADVNEMETDHGNSTDDVLLIQLIEMGFEEDVARHALLQVNNSSLGAALEFIRSSKPQKDIEKSNRGTLGINSSSTVAREIDYNALSSTTPDSSQSGQDNSEGLEDTATESSLVINIPNPVFCRDGVSAQLEAMYCAAGVKTQHEALFVIIHALMLESGFQSKNTAGDPEDRHKSTEAMPIGWNDRSVFTLQYVHHLCPSKVCKVLASSLGPFLCIHAWSSDTENDSFQAKLVVSQYVRGDVSLSSGARSVYRNLHKASRLVKDCLVHPLLATIKSYLGLTDPYSLAGLSPEIQLMILSQLDAKSVVRLSSTCKGLCSICNDQKLWKFFCQRDFGVETTNCGCWKKQYKVLYNQRQPPRYGESGGFLVLPQSYPEIPIANPFLPRFPPGIIGGPHDVFPGVINLQRQGERGIPQYLPDNTRSGLRTRTGKFPSGRMIPYFNVRH